MSDTPSFGTFETSVPVAEAPKSATPFRIAVLGDFSGRVNRKKIEPPDKLVGRKARKINRDNFDDIISEMGVALMIPFGDKNKQIGLSFESMESFHPDEILGRVDHFEDLDGDKAKCAALKKFLHQPAFNARESAWLVLDWLLRRVQQDEKTEVVLYDIAQQEFTAALKAEENVAASPLFQLLIEKGTQGPKGQPWALILANYAFDFNAEGAEVLGRMAKIAQHAAAPFLAATHSKIVEKPVMPDDGKAAWEALRNLPEAAYLGLSSCRFLVRLPYGSNTRSIEKLGFEEFETPADKKGYVWGNPAFGVASLIAQSFSKDGWAFKPGKLMDLENMHMHTYVDDDDDRQVTIAETWLNPAAAGKLAALGLMPFVSIKGRDAIRLDRFQSLGIPAKGELKGNWNRQDVKKAVGTKKPTISASVGMMAGDPTPRRAAPAAAQTGDTSSDPYSDGPQPVDTGLHGLNVDDVGSTEPTPSPDAPPADAPPADDSTPSFDSSSFDSPPADAAPMDADMAALLGSTDSPPADAPPADMPTDGGEANLDELLKNLG